MVAIPLPIEGTYNLRDLGGFRADGGMTKAGALFRSDALASLSDRGREQFAALDVVRVIDLRDDTERARFPDALPASAALVAHPIFPSAAAHVSMNLDVYSLTDLLYREHGDTLAAAVTMLSEPGVTVFHCTAGKDRTGAVAALTLLAVGVERDDVMHDYSRSEEYLRGEWYDAHIAVLERLGIEVTPAVAQLIGATPIEAIDRALAAVEQRHGSVRDYLLTHGTDESALERLHAQLVS